MTRPLALDLFCGAGGASMGLHRAGFDVVGVDRRPMPRYPFPFVQGDALNPPFDLSRFDFIWASPPCQAHTAMKSMHNAKAHADLIPQTRAMLIASGRPWVMENVPGAPMRYSTMLCGTMFGLGCEGAELQRHRIFESNFLILGPACNHSKKPTIGIYGEGCRDSRRKSDKRHADFTVEDGRKAMGVDWMTLAELCQAIPPAYGQFIGAAALTYLQAEKAA